MDERTIPATPTRRKQLAANGDVAKSEELSSIAAFLALIALASASFQGFIYWFESYVGDLWVGPSVRNIDAADLQSMLGILIAKLAGLFGGAVLLSCAVNITMNFLQTGVWKFSWPQANRASIWQKMFRLFSFDSVAGIISSLCRLGLVCLVVYVVIKNDAANIFVITNQSITSWLASLSQLIFKTCFALGGGLLVMGAVDFAWKKYRYESRIRMTPQELRDELRQSQSDPQFDAQRQHLLGQILEVGRAGEARDATQKL